jgi:oxygen-independent coproporphyrinogen-3 oxidase
MPASAKHSPVEFNRELIVRYDTTGPRYTSYPTAAEFRPDFSGRNLRRHIDLSNERSPQRPLSLYCHIPFCDTICFYCACNKVVTRNRGHSLGYLDRLHAEIDRMADLFRGRRRVTQLHWGGGTPTFLSHEQLRGLMERIRERFPLAGDAEGEYGIEIDPRRLPPGTVALLREIGFNRLSMGIQDLDPDVQQAVNRIQPAELTFGVLDEARAAGFRSVSVDLMYGLPRQTPEHFARTLRAVIAAGPDRLSVFNYAHLPHRFKTQRQIDEAELPSAGDKLTMLARTIELLQSAGYVYIGMDHFAREDDELARALRDGTLQRNFQGYSTHAECELVAMGNSAISQIGDCYAQNAHTLDDYYARIDAGELATVRGVELNADDHLRRGVISDLMCRFGVRFTEVEARFGIDFKNYFRDELRDLEGFSADGLVDMDDDGVCVTASGRLLIRNIAMVFDAYRRRGGQQQAFSKVI